MKPRATLLSLLLARHSLAAHDASSAQQLTPQTRGAETSTNSIANATNSTSDAVGNGSRSNATRSSGSGVMMTMTTPRDHPPVALVFAHKDPAPLTVWSVSAHKPDEPIARPDSDAVVDRISHQRYGVGGGTFPGPTAETVNETDKPPAASSLWSRTIGVPRKWATQVADHLRGRGEETEVTNESR